MGHGPWTIAGFGEVLWDMLPGGKALGGAPLNFSYHAANMGATCYPVSAIGRDVLGNEILLRCDELGISREYLFVHPDYPTGTVDVVIDQSGQPHYQIACPVAWDFIPLRADLLALAARCDAICFGTLASRHAVSRHTCEALLQAVPAKCLRIYDVNFRPSVDPAIAKDYLKMADVLKLNHEELPRLAAILGYTGSTDEVVTRILNAYPLRLVALTAGAQGSTLYTPHEKDHCPADDIPIVDTVGAGDAFTAAIAIGLLKGDSLPILHQRAAELAAYVCTQKGGTPPMRDSAESAK